MDRQATALILANAIIWAALLVGAAYLLRGTGCWNELSTVLFGAAGASVVVVGGGVQRLTID